MRRGATRLKSRDTHKAYLRDPTYTCIPNFNCVAQFGRRVIRGKTQNLRKIDQKTTFLRQWEATMRLKNQDAPFQKAHLGSLLNVHTKFQLPSSIWRVVMREKNSKNNKNHQKISFLVLWGGVKGLKSLNSQKTQILPLLSVHAKLQLPNLIWWGDGGNTTFSRSQRRQTSYLPS